MESTILNTDSSCCQSLKKQHVKCPLLPNHKWFVVISACICQAISNGFVFSFGSLLLEILEEFGESRAAATVAQSVMIGIMLGAAVINGSLVNRVGLQKSGVIGGSLAFIGVASCYFASSVTFLVISLGIVTGWGCSVLFLASATATRQNFKGSGKFLALSCVSSSGGVGAICYPYLYSWLVPRFGMQGTFLVVSGLFLNTIPAAGLWRYLGTETQLVDEGGNRTVVQTKRNTFVCIVCGLLHNKQYILFVLAYALTQCGNIAFVALAFDIFKSRGVDVMQSLQIFMVFNITSTIARMAPGSFKQIPHFGSLVIVFILILAGLIGYIGLMIAQNFTGIMLSCIGVGVGYGGMVGSVTVATGKITEQNKFTGAVSLVLTVHGVVSGIASPLAGLVYDKTQSYDIVLYCFAPGMVGGAVCALIAAILRGRQHLAKKTVCLPVLE